MVINLSNEEGYLYYFRQLIQFEETLKREKPCHNGFELVHITDVQGPKNGRIKESNTQPKDKALLGKVKNKSKNTPAPQMMTLQVNFVGKFSDRIAMRRNILENLNIYCNDEELYDMFLDRLLNFEESLIKD